MSAMLAVFKRELSIALRRPAECEQPSATAYGIVVLFATSVVAKVGSGEVW